MPVPPEQLDDIAGTVAAIYREAETALVRIIAGHLAGDLDSDMQAPAWADKKLAAVRALRRSAQAVIAGLQADSSTAVREAAAQAYRAGWTSALAELPAAWFPKSGLAEEVAPAVEELPGFAAVEAMAAAVHTDIGIPSRNILRNVLDTYRAVTTAAVARTVTGVQTRREASQAAWKRFMDKGITGFVDRAGRRWQLSSYVEMAVRTVTQRAAVTGQTDRLDALGVDLVMVSDNVQECAICRPYEGKVLRLNAGPTGLITVPHELTDAPFQVDVVSTLADAMIAGLFHPNCRHSVSAFLPGVSRLPERDTADPEGNKARVQQRKLERDIRRHKVNEVGALDETSKKAAHRKVLDAQAALRAHLEEHPNLKRLRYREQIGAGNIPPKGKDDPVSGGIGPDVQPTLDGSAAVVLPSQRRASSAPAKASPAPADQLALDDVRTPAQLADALAAGKVKPADLAPDELRQADAEFAARAALLGKPDQVSRIHKAIRTELGRRQPVQLPAPVPAPVPSAPGMQAGRRFDTNAAAVEWAKKKFPLPPLEKTERRALNAYTGPDYVPVNNALRGLAEPKGKAREKVDRLMTGLDAAFAKAAAPESIVVHRTVNRATAAILGADVTVPRTMHALVGEVFTEPGFMSTSLGRAAEFVNDINFMITIPKGYPAINVMPLSRMKDGEREVLINRNARYVIHAAYQRGDTWYIEAELVPEGWSPGADWAPDPYGDAWKGYAWGQKD